MAAKNKKAPSGKKARRKAKLDRQWGEEVDPNYDKRTSYQRGKKKTLKFDEVEDEGLKNKRRKISNSNLDINNNNYEIDNSDEEDTIEDTSMVLSKLLQKIDARNERCRQSRKDKISTNKKKNDVPKRYIAKGDLNATSDDSVASSKRQDDIYSEKIDMFDSDDDMAIESSNDQDYFSRHFMHPSMADNHIFSSDWTTKGDTLIPIPKSVPETLRNLKILCHGPVATKVEEKPTVNVENLFEKNTQSYLRSVWSNYNQKSMTSSQDKEQMILTPLQSLLYPSLSFYSDIFVTIENRNNRQELYDLTILHVLNHLMTAYSRLLKHNRRLGEKDSKNISLPRSDDSLSPFKDQGYTRPKVLILCPTRGTALSYLKRLFVLAGPSVFVDGIDRLNLDYDVESSSEVIDDNPRGNILSSKGEEWLELFGEDTNSDDDFKLGLSLCSSGKKKKDGKKYIFKLYTDFMHSDMIIASPLSLKLHIEREDTTDFLSSIEICKILHSDVLLMQNWDHINSILLSVNKQPQSLNSTDFSRVREYFLAGQAQHWRQMIILSNLKDPNITGTFKRHSKSIEGRIQINTKIGVSEASICDVIVKVKHVFQRVNCPSISTQGEMKLRYFSENVLPQLLRLQQKHTLIYIPSYFDFVAIRNLLLKSSANFVSVTEYARVSEVSRGRARFQQGRKNIMLYTGRCHFFKRHKIKGARHLIFFGLPEHPDFYSDMVNSLNNMGKTRVDFDLESPISCLSIFTKYEMHSLERIVGTSHCEHIIKSEKQIFLFNT